MFFSFPLFIISIQIDSSSLDLYIFKSLQTLQFNLVEIYKKDIPFLTLLEYAQSCNLEG